MINKIRKLHWQHYAWFGTYSDTHWQQIKNRSKVGSFKYLRALYDLDRNGKTKIGTDFPMLSIFLLILASCMYKT